jgi:hypothetical protein
MEAGRFAPAVEDCKLVTNERLHQYVQEKLAGSSGHRRILPGLGAPEWVGGNTLHRGDREWVTAWCPEQISNRLAAQAYLPCGDLTRCSTF